MGLKVKNNNRTIIVCKIETFQAIPLVGWGILKVCIEMILSKSEPVIDIESC